MTAVRILHFADLHLGVESGGRVDPSTGLNQRVSDVLDRLDEVVSCALDEGVHAVLFAGDAFKHQHPTPTLQKLFAERVRRLARGGVTVFLLIGNHDLPKMAALAHPFSIYHALEVERVVVGDRAQVYRLPLGGGLPDLQVAALPHFSRQRVLSRLPAELADPDKAIEQAIQETVRSLGDAVDPALPAVFCGHCHVNQSDIGPGQALFGVSDLEVTMSTLASTTAFPYFALGHVHKRQVLRTDPFVAYSGSLERVDFGEGETVKVHRDRVTRSPAEDKGFYMFDLRQDGGRWGLGAAPTFRTVGARRFVTVHVDVTGQPDPTAAAIAELGRADLDPDGCVVKVVVHLDTLDRPRLVHRDVKEALREAHDVVVVAQADMESGRVRDPRFATRMGPAEALARYLETREDWAEDREALLAMGTALIEEVGS
ncbi:MAG TPA: exonuclease SbcCD subunit D [Actinomycetota bacterium]|nr:exonuclease SbcCD subunit D [Actinomycetota bacterium]